MFRLKKEAWDWNTSIPRFREECEQGARKAGKLPEGIGVSPVVIAGLPRQMDIPIDNRLKDGSIPIPLCG